MITSQAFNTLQLSQAIGPKLSLQSVEGTNHSFRSAALSAQSGSAQSLWTLSRGGNKVGRIRGVRGEMVDPSNA